MMMIMMMMIDQEFSKIRPSQKSRDVFSQTLKQNLKLEYDVHQFHVLSIARVQFFNVSGTKFT